MKITYFKYIPALLVVTSFFCCKVEDSETWVVRGKGFTVMTDVVEVIEDFAGFAKVGFAAIYYDGCTTQEKIEFDNSVANEWVFRKIDERWELTDYRLCKYYVELLDEGTLLNITRARGYDDEKGKPVFDSARMEYTEGSLWTLTLNETEVYRYYTYRPVRSGTAAMSVDLRGDSSILPPGFALSGAGKYVSTDSSDNKIEVSWNLATGYFECFHMEYFAPLIQGSVEVEAGVPGGDKDKIKALFDRNKQTLSLEVNGSREEADPYF